MAKIVKVKTSKNKVIEYKQQGNIAFRLLAQSQQLSEDARLDMHVLLSYPLTPVPYSIGLADGFLAKTDKSKGFHYLTNECENVTLPKDQSECLIIEDGNAVFHCLTAIPDTFGEICNKILGYAIQKSVVIFSTDMYASDSVKSMERLRRGCSEKLIVGSASTRKPKDWKSFLSNDDNKKQLVSQMLTNWSNSSNSLTLRDHEVILVCEGKAFQLTSDGNQVSCKEMQCLYSTQEETDSRVVLYCHYARDRGFKYVRVKSPDSDIFFILLYHAGNLNGLQILFETGEGNKKQCIDVTALSKSFSAAFCSASLGLHAFTGCDSVSCFKGKGKVKAFKLLEKNNKFQKAFSLIGDVWIPPNELVQDLEDFTCSLYGYPRINNVNEVRHLMLQTKCGEDLSRKTSFDLSLLPPCKSSLLQHVMRASYQLGIWKRAQTGDPEIPSPIGHGWKRDNDGACICPNWTDSECIPSQLVDVLAVLESDSSDSSDSDGLEELSSSDDSDNELS